MEGADRKKDRHKPTEARKKNRHKPGYIRPSRRKPFNPSAPSEPAPSETRYVSKETGFTSWEDFLNRTTEKERLAWCLTKANCANNERALGRRR